jgi:mannose-1-phosphate guanylyltransferase
MIPVGDEQKPVLEYIIRLFAHHGIDNLVLLVGYKHQQIRNYFDDGSRFGVHIEYVLDDPNFPGSANALVNAFREGVLARDDDLVVYYGDILSDFDLREMVTKHIQANAGATMALSNGFKIRVGTAEIVDGFISKFIEKPELELPVSVGMLVFSGSVLEELNHLHEMDPSESFDIMGDVIPHLLEKGIPVLPYISDAFWYDLGSLERYETFETEALDKNLSYLLE